MAPLLLGTNATRRVALTMEPIDPLRAHRPGPRRVCRVHQPSKITRACPHAGQRCGRGVATRPPAAKNSSRPTSTANTINTGCRVQPTALGRRPASRGPTRLQDRDILTVTSPDHKPATSP
ncbi:hypothetical protein BH24ACT15_BH24ACT15_30050 [soil metagenome]